jgi:cytochrome c biogenesis protein CcdA
MSKHVTTQWYIGAWLVAVIAMILIGIGARSVQAGSAPAPALMIMGFVIMASSLVMLVMWIGALLKLAQLGAWGWFVGVLILHLVGLGIIGMVAYAISGPEDRSVVAIRPPTPV